MTANLLLGFWAVFLCLINKDKEKGLLWAFIFATIFLCIRYDWGNDYMSYLQGFQFYSDQSFDLFDIQANASLRRNQGEYGWVILNRLFAYLGLGFFGLVIALTVFENVVLYRFTVKYAIPKSYWVVVLFWILSISFCMNASMMRQYFCICLYLIVIDLMIQKRKKFYLLWAIGIIFLGATVHVSFITVLFSLPLFFLGLEPGKKSYIWLAVIGIVYIVWSLYGRDFIEPYMIQFLEDSDEFSSYMYYLNLEKKDAMSTGLGRLFHFFMFAVWLVLLSKVEKKQQAIIILIIVSYFFDVVSAIAPLAGRLALYFSSVALVCWTYLVDYAKKYPILYGVLIIQIAIKIREIFGFFYNPVWIEKCLHYHTIFEAAEWM